MSYDTRLQGTLALDPPPDATTTAALRSAIDALSQVDRGKRSLPCRWKLTPLGGGLVNEDEFDWETQLDWLDTVLREILAPRGISLVGRLEAIGEDDQQLATVQVDATGIAVERGDDGDDGDDTTAWVAQLDSEDEEDRCVAAAQLAARDVVIAVPALTRALSDTSAEVRRRALESLGSFGESAAPAIDEVIGCLADGSPFVRYWATFALGRMGARAAKALEPLSALTRDTADGPRYGALDAIKRIRG